MSLNIQSLESAQLLFATNWKRAQKLFNIFAASKIVLVTTNKCNLKCKYCCNYYTGLTECADTNLILTFFSDYFRKQKNIKYTTADLESPWADVHLNVEEMPLETSSYESTIK